MTSRTRLVGAGALVAALAAAAMSWGADEARRTFGPKAVTVTVRGLTATTVVGSNCVRDVADDDPNDNQVPDARCEEVAYPLRPKGRLPVGPRSRARIDARVPARMLSASLVVVRGSRIDHVGPLLRGRPLRPDGRHWKVRLPTHLRDANALSIDVEYADGAEANFWAALAAR